MYDLIKQMNNYASFVLPEDQILVTICKQMYGFQSDIGDYKLMKIGNNHCKAWVKGNDAIVGIRGTNVGGHGAINDIMDDIKLSRGGDDLIIVENSKTIIESLFSLGYNITITGHSLGGFAAFKLIEIFPNIIRGVSFNGAAPILGGPYIGSGQKTRFYHIVGDVVSTHMDHTTCELIRVKIGKEVNWDKTVYYHSIDRFTEYNQWINWSAQQEQDDLYNYFTFFSNRVSVAFGIITKIFSLPQLINIIVDNPIPGSISKQSNWNQTPIQLGIKTVSNILGIILKPGLDLIGVEDFYKDVKVKEKTKYIEDLLFPTKTVLLKGGGKVFDIFHEQRLKKTRKRRRLK